MHTAARQIQSGEGRPGGLGWEEDGSGLRGRPLRRAALAVLLRADRPLRVGDVLATIEGWGFQVHGAYPRKAVADALAHEHDRGWARRVGWGTYVSGTISVSSRRRILASYPGAHRQW